MLITEVKADIEDFFDAQPEKKKWGASLLLRAIVDTETELVFRVWLHVARTVTNYPKVKYTYDNVRTLRVDVPIGRFASLDYLQGGLEQWWATNGDHPRDPPIIKG